MNNHHVSQGNSLDELENLYHKSYQHHAGSLEDEDNNSITDSFGTSSSARSDSSNEDQSFTFSKRLTKQNIDSYRPKRRKPQQAMETRVVEYSFDNPQGHDLIFAASYTDDLGNCDLFDSTSLNDDSGVDEAVPANSNNGTGEAEEWLDVLSFFCGPSGPSFDEAEMLGGLRRIRSNLSLPMC